jgi:hypothetical protein
MCEVILMNCSFNLKKMVSLAIPKRSFYSTTTVFLFLVSMAC